MAVVLENTDDGEQVQLLANIVIGENFGGFSAVKIAPFLRSFGSSASVGVEESREHWREGLQRSGAFESRADGCGRTNLATEGTLSATVKIDQHVSQR